MSKEMTYWGVLCRACSEPVAFGSPSHQQFELESAYARPGAIRCAKGHNFIYFPRDFKFFTSATEIPEAVMEANREAHIAVNPLPIAPSNHLHGTRWVPDANRTAAGSMAAPNAFKAPTAPSGPDPRREVAQMMAKQRWSNWAIKKTH